MKNSDFFIWIILDIRSGNIVDMSSMLFNDSSVAYEEGLDYFRRKFSAKGLDYIVSLRCFTFDK